MFQQYINHFPAAPGSDNNCRGIEVDHRVVNTLCQRGRGFKQFTHTRCIPMPDSLGKLAEYFGQSSAARFNLVLETRPT